MHHRQIARAAFILFLTAMTRPALAQATQAEPVVAPGSYVRVVHTALCCPSPMSGRLVSLDADSLRIRSEKERSPTAVAALSRTTIVSIDVRKLVGAHKAQGAANGLVLGAVAGAAIGYTSGSSCRNCDGSGGNNTLGLLAGAAGGAALGLIVGTAIGAMVPHYRWTRARIAA